MYSLQDGQLKMLEGYLEFFMQPDLAETYLKLKEELGKTNSEETSESRFGYL